METERRAVSGADESRAPTAGGGQRAYAGADAGHHDTTIELGAKSASSAAAGATPDPHAYDAASEFDASLSPRFFRALGFRGRVWIRGDTHRERFACWWNHCRAQFWIEVSLFGFYWPWALVLGLAAWFHSIMTNLVFYLYNVENVWQQPPLFDLGQHLFAGPSSEDATSALRLLGYYGVLVTGVFTLVQPFWATFAVSRDRDGAPVRFCANHALKKASMVYAVGSVLRCLSFLATVLPAPASYCQAPANGGTYNPARAPHTAAEVVTRFDLEFGCGDLIFSGHVFTLSLLLYITQRWSMWVGQKVICWLFYPLLLYFTIVDDKHYSVDVVIAVYITPLLWFWVNRLALFEEHREYDDFVRDAVLLGCDTVEERRARRTMKRLARIYPLWSCFLLHPRKDWWYAPFTCACVNSRTRNRRRGKAERGGEEEEEEEVEEREAQGVEHRHGVTAVRMDHDEYASEAEAEAEAEAFRKRTEEEGMVVHADGDGADADNRAAATATATAMNTPAGRSGWP